MGRGGVGAEGMGERVTSKIPNASGWSRHMSLDDLPCRASSRSFVGQPPTESRGFVASSGRSRAGNAGRAISTDRAPGPSSTTF